jgi:signal transduction histidine kinase
MMRPDEKAPALDFEAAMTASEAEIVRQYDRQRRQRLLTLLGTTFGAGIGVLFVAVALLILMTRSFTATSAIELAGIILNILINVAVVLLARSGRVEASAILFAIGAGFVPAFNVFTAAAAGGASPFNVIFLLGAIIVVSLAGRPWMVLGTALLSSLTTIYLVDFAPIPATSPAQADLHGYLAATGSSSLPVLFVVYWGMALLLLVQWRSYQRLLLELADVRVQVERARRLDELKDQFIRSVNHELRTPIMTLLGYVDLLMNPENRRSAEKVERYIQRADRAGQSLRRLLAGILDTRRLNTSAGSLEPQSIDILTTLEDVIALLPTDGKDGSDAERALHVHLSPGLQVWAEPIQFQQILINLLTNAVKYSPPGTPVDIDARIASVDHAAHHGWLRRPAAVPPPMAEIAVRDYGLGIPPEQQPLLFQRFMRLPRELESNVMGTGLGLYLCKTMAERMGGSIRVESSGIPGEGTTFFVRLPLPPGETQHATEDLPPVYIERHTGPLAAVPSSGVRT